MPGEGRHFVGDSLHQIPVTGHEIRAVANDVVVRSIEDSCQVSFGNRQSHRIAEPLAQGTGRGFDPSGDPKLGMTRRLALPLPEIDEFLQGQVIAREMEQAV